MLNSHFVRRNPDISINFRADELPSAKKRFENILYTRNDITTGTEYQTKLGRIDLIASELNFTKPQLIGLGESTLNKLLNVKVKDEQDTSWLDEKIRITNMLEQKNKTKDEIKDYLQRNPPLGRSQYKTDKQVSLTQSNLNSSDKIQELFEEYTSGSANNSQQFIYIITELTRIMSNIQSLEQLTIEQHQKILTMLTKVPDKITRGDLNIVARYVDYKYQDLNKGKINLLLYKNAKNDSNLDINNPVLSESKNQLQLTPIKISTMDYYLKLKNIKQRILDIDNATVIFVSNMIDIIDNTPQELDNPIFELDSLEKQ